VCQEGVDLGLGHFAGVAHVVEEDEALDPVAIGLLGPAAVMASVQGLAQAV
jgi:hypothetical protein